jgi:hypothetical protein
VRFSLLSLFGLVALCAVGLGALASSSYPVASSFFTLTVISLCGAATAAIVAGGRQRAFWLAFTLVGWIHFVLVLGPWFDDRTGEFMLSRHIIDALGSAMGHKVFDHQTMPGIWFNLPYATGSSSYRYLNFIVIGQCLLTLGLAWTSAVVASYLYARRKHEQ